MRIIVEINEENPEVSTSGGQQWIADIEIDDYTIEIGDLYVDNVKSETMKRLAVKIVNHLMINGHCFEFKQGLNGPEFTAK
jgi:hypothetical protein